MVDISKTLVHAVIPHDSVVYVINKEIRVKELHGCLDELLHPTYNFFSLDILD